MFEVIKNALLTVGVPVSHYEAKRKPDKYIVWAEGSTAQSLGADNRISTRVMEGTADYFTREEDDPNIAAIEAALNNGKIAWRLNSVQYEEQTGYIHYEWVWRVLRG